jgi:glycosyltransferase involved in cell wall biosynthesis
VEKWLLILYLIVGAFFWALYGFGLYKSRKRMRLVRNPPDLVPEPFPLVTVLVPAKDEGERIRGCIDSILKLDYPNFNVIAIDDRSKDQTPAILDEIAARDPRLKVVHIKDGELPPRWTGKNHALHSGSVHADGEWLLFVDADVILYPAALRLALGIAFVRRYGLLSLMPRMEFHNFWEGVLTPLGGFAAAMIHLASLTNSNDRPQTAFANGQFMLFDRKAYNALGGHERVRDVLGEDTAIARIMKKEGLRPRVSWGADLCQVRMYDSFGKIIRGWSRILFASAATIRPNVIGLVGLFLVAYSLVPAAAWAVYRQMHPLHLWWTHGWTVAVAAHWILMTTMICAMYKMACTKPWYGLIFIPLSGPFLVYMLAKAIHMGISKRVEWRGTRYGGTSATVANAPR